MAHFMHTLLLHLVHIKSHGRGLPPSLLCTPHVGNVANRRARTNDGATLASAPEDEDGDDDDDQEEEEETEDGDASATKVCERNVFIR